MSWLLKNGLELDDEKLASTGECLIKGCLNKREEKRYWLSENYVDSCFCEYHNKQRGKKI